MRKILDAAALLSLVLSGSIAGLGIYGYLYATNADNQDKAKAYVMDQVKSALPDLIGGGLSGIAGSPAGGMPALPEMTGPATSMPTPNKKGESGGLRIPGPSKLPF